MPRYARHLDKKEKKLKLVGVVLFNGFAIGL